MKKCNSCAFGSSAELVQPALPAGLWHKAEPEQRIPVVVCKYMPTPATKKPDDWCGQHVDAKLLQAEQTKRGEYKVGF